jgi:hypothetical protein
MASSSLKPHSSLAKHLAAVRVSIVRNGDTTCTVNQDALVHLMNECDILLDAGIYTNDCGIQFAGDDCG